MAVEPEMSGAQKPTPRVSNQTTPARPERQAWVPRLEPERPQQSPQLLPVIQALQRGLHSLAQVQQPRSGPRASRRPEELRPVPRPSLAEEEPPCLQLALPRQFSRRQPCSPSASQASLFSRQAGVRRGSRAAFPAVSP